VICRLANLFPLLFVTSEFLLLPFGDLVAATVYPYGFLTMRWHVDEVKNVYINELKGKRSIKFIELMI
jgi:hypothetical protein